MIVAVPLAAAVGALLWLNRSLAWGWLTAGAFILVAFASVCLLRRPRWHLLAALWLAGGAASGAVVALSSPPIEVRVAGGDARSLTAVVPTEQGPVRGVLNEERTVEIFAGLPYAQPPVGDLRWRPPQSLTERDGTFVADRFSPASMQATSTFATRALSQLVTAPLEDTLLNPYPVSEDSLTLNIWRSAAPSVAPRPVLVFIPGGGFQTGSGALPLYDGESMAARGDMLTVTINYRLGVFGFLSHPQLAEESPTGTSGNYGIQDQIAALAWIRSNIAAFGGDPERVTVAGESAGGESVCILGATPLAEGLFDGIIAGSGACMGTAGEVDGGDQFDTRLAAEDAGRQLSRYLDDATIEELREVPAERLHDAASDLSAHWRPSIDGQVLPQLPAEIYAAGQQNDVPLLLGSNADEASLALASPPDLAPDEYRLDSETAYGDSADEYLRLYPGDSAGQALSSSLQAQTDSVMTRAMLRWARLQSESGASKAHLYHFSHTPPEAGLEKFGAYHGAEVAYAYDNLNAVGDLRPMPEDLRLRDQMSTYWTSFVSTGDPNAVGLPRWPSVRSEPDHIMDFSAAGSVVRPRPHAAAVDFWMTYPGPLR